MHYFTRLWNSDFWKDYDLYSTGLQFKQKEVGGKSLYFLELSVPGYSKEDVSVQIVEDSSIVEINGKRKSLGGEDRFFRTAVYLPENADVSTFVAKANNGILSLSVQIAPPKQPESIKIKVE